MTELLETFGGTGGSYDAVGGRLKYGYHLGKRFEFVRGEMYKVSHAGREKRHEGAVGIYLGSRRVDSGYMAILNCRGRKFYAPAGALAPWEGEITDEHLVLIASRKKVHLSLENRCACKCDSTPLAAPPRLPMGEFLRVAEAARCSNCNGIAQTLERRDQAESSHCQS